MESVKRYTAHVCYKDINDLKEMVHHLEVVLDDVPDGELVDRAHVTRLQAELEQWKANNMANARAAGKLVKILRDQRDALKAEVERLKSTCQGFVNLHAKAQSELTKARELNSAAADELHQANVRVILAEEQLAQYQCRHEWIDNGEDLLVCPKCGKEDSGPEPFGWVQTSGPSINRFTQEWDVVEEWSDNGYEWVELFTTEANQSAPAEKGEPVAFPGYPPVPEDRKLPADQPAPVAVSLPERKTVKAGLLSESNTHNQGWNACLDEFARLNSEPKP